MMFHVMTELVRHVLHHPHEVAWTIQGFGMGRCYLGGDEVRLNVWHSRFAVNDVSIIHNHPWDLQSWVMAGRLVNRRFVRGDTGWSYQHVRIHPGMGHTAAIVKSRVDTAYLQQRPAEVYLAGHTYSQAAHEIHQTSFDDGTVTINRRTNRREDVADV